MGFVEPRGAEQGEEYQQYSCKAGKLLADRDGACQSITTKRLAWPRLERRLN